MLMYVKVVWSVCAGTAAELQLLAFVHVHGTIFLIGVYFSAT